MELPVIYCMIAVLIVIAIILLERFAVSDRWLGIYNTKTGTHTIVCTTHKWSLHQMDDTMLVARYKQTYSDARHTSHAIEILCNDTSLTTKEVHAGDNDPHHLPGTTFTVRHGSWIALKSWVQQEDLLRQYRTHQPTHL